VALLFDPIFQGVDVPRGDGRRVVVLPGLFGGDLYLEPLRAWLRRVGYAPVRSTLAINMGCPQRLRDQVQAEIVHRMRGTTDPIALIGHSRGGLIAWAIAAAMQDRVSHLAVLGSPIGSVRAAIASGSGPGTAAGGMLARASTLARRILDPDCDMPACGCSFIADIQRALSPATLVLRIVSRDDRIVPPEATRIVAGQTVEVGGGHIGLVYNAEVYRALGRFLTAKA
jgi:triacylglycerol lipase